MKIVTKHEAKTRLSRLVEEAAKGEPFIIALDTPMPSDFARVGFLAGQIEVPDDFGRMGQAEIERLFGGVDA